MALLAAGTGVPATVAAQACTLPADYRSDLRPDPEGTPTIVRIGVMVADVTRIDDVSQSLEGDFIVRKSWTDARLAGAAGCRFQRAEIWFPITDILNSSELRRSRGQFSADQVSVGPNGRVEYFQRFVGTIATYHQLYRFPFDTHRLDIRIAPLEDPVDRIQLELDTGITKLADLLNIPDWTVSGIDPRIEDQELPEFGLRFSVMHLVIVASRNSQYYVWKMMMPLLLIVLMSFVVFWISPERFGPQIGLAATSMLTLIAFQFALTGMLPKLSYFTLLDELILGSTVLVFATLVQATTTAILVTHERTDLALRMDRICRWVFPIALAALWVLVLR